ncbi:hypothetical protein ACFQ0I_15955, partial [Mariniflexile aquimaris]
FSPEVQTYGTIGLLSIIKKYNIKPTEEEKRILDYLKDKNSDIMSCSDCVIEPTKFVDIIKFYQ